MGIKVEEDLLFEKLRISLPEAVCDGVVDEKNFFSARYRIVYILKEVNGGESWDLRKFLYDGGVLKHGIILQDGPKVFFHGRRSFIGKSYKKIMRKEEENN